jgi:MFS family permease
LLVMAMVSLGQLILNVPDSTGISIFVLLSVLASIAIVPIAITKVDAPPPPTLASLNLVELYHISPLAMIAAVSTGALQGSVYGLGPVYANAIGLDVEAVTWFMFMLLGGAVIGMWPLGKLSDTIDRRFTLLIALTIVTASSVGLAALQPAGWLLSVIALIYGASAWPLYTILSAHLNDHATTEQRVSANAGLLVMYGIGAAAGPLLAAGTNTLLDSPSGLFVFTAVIATLTVASTLWRMSAREGIAVEDKGTHTIVPRTSPIVAEIVAEMEEEEE